jgi:hypothetical protein
MNAIVTLILLVAVASAATNAPIVTIRGKKKTITEVETMFREYARRQKLEFDFRGTRRTVDILTNGAGVCMTFSRSNSASYLHGSVYRDGKIRARVDLYCGGTK